MRFLIFGKFAFFAFFAFFFAFFFEVSRSNFPDLQKFHYLDFFRNFSIKNQKEFFVWANVLDTNSTSSAQVPMDSERDAVECVSSDHGVDEEAEEEEETQPSKKVKLNYGAKASLSSWAIFHDCPRKKACIQRLLHRVYDNFLR